MTPIENTETSKNPDTLSAVQSKVQACMQCGTCTGSCPNAFAMDLTPRHMWRLVLMGDKEVIFKSKTFALCSSCYMCTLRCPRGLPLTEAMAGLKRIAAREKIGKYRDGTYFYQSFIESVRYHGRVREMAFMSAYFMKMGNPFLPLRFSGLGLRLMGKGKVSIQNPFSKGKGVLDPIFKKVEELEGLR